MSLINQMLRDLDKREPDKGKPRAILTPTPVPQDRPKRSPFRWPLWLLLVGISMVLALSLSPQTQRFWDYLNDGSAVSEQASEAVIQTEPSQSTEKTKVQIQNSDEPVIATAIKPVPPVLEETDREQSLPVVVEEIGQIPMALSSESVNQPATIKQANAEPFDEGQPVVAADKALGMPETQVNRSGEINRVTKLVTRSEPVETKRTVPVERAVAQARISKETEQEELKRPASSPVVQVKKVPPKRVQASADTLYQTALLHLNEGRLSDADEALHHVLILDRNNHEARRILAMLLLNAGDQAAGRALLNEGIQLTPGHAPFVTLLSRAYMDGGDSVKAIRLIEKHLADTGGDPELLALLGSLYQQASQFSSAVQVYRQLIKKQPDNARAVAGLAISLDASGERTQALVFYKQALDLGSLPDEVNEYARQRVTVLSAER